MAIMTMSADTWAAIRLTFTESERAAIREAIVGETLCPRCCVIDTSRLEDWLLRDLQAAIRAKL